MPHRGGKLRGAASRIAEQRLLLNDPGLSIAFRTRRGNSVQRRYRGARHNGAGLQSHSSDSERNRRDDFGGPPPFRHPALRHRNLYRNLCFGASRSFADTRPFQYGVVGVGVFAYPHPLHNLFGLSELIGYQAPLILALTWRDDTRVRSAVKLSWLFYILVVVAIALNLSPLYGERTLSAYVHPIHGLVQRALFGAWFGWCFVLGLVLFRPSSQAEATRL